MILDPNNILGNVASRGILLGFLKGGSLIKGGSF